MSDVKITGARFERSQLIFDGAGALTDAPVLRCGGKEARASVFECGEDSFSCRFNMAACLDGRPLEGGSWSLGTGGEFDGASADFSADGCVYKLRVKSGGDVVVECEFEPQKKSAKSRAGVAVLRFLFKLGKLSGKKVVLFTSESRTDASGNMRWVLGKAKEFKVDLDCVRYSFIDSKRAGRIKKARYMIKTAFLLGKSRVVVADDYCPIIYIMNFDSTVKVVQLWHACGAFKTVGYARLGREGSLTADSLGHRNYTHVTVSGTAVVNQYAEAFGITADKVESTGIPRTDCLFDSEYKKSTRASFSEKYPQFSGKRIVLFAPTFRGKDKDSAYYPVDAVDLDKLAAFCRENGFAVVFKMHPFVKQSFDLEGYEDVFANSSDVRELNSLLISCHVLVTDYSSSVYEAALLGKDIVLFTFDLSEYEKERDFFTPIDKLLPGCSVNTCDELISALKDGRKCDTAAVLREVDACDGGASERVARIIFGN